MKKRIVVAVVLAVLVSLALTGCLSTNTQPKDFFQLVTAGTPQDVQAAISNGADVNARDTAGMTALMDAAGANKNPEVITILLKAGADIKARGLHFSQTPLMSAAYNNPNPVVIATLLKAGADAKAKDNEGKTAFDYAQTNEKLKGTDALKQLEEASK